MRYHLQKTDIYRCFKNPSPVHLPEYMHVHPMTLPNCLTKMDRLVAIATREQWSIADLDWSIVNFHGIPPIIKQNIATAFSHLLFGEKAALQCAQRLKGFLQHPIHQQLCDFQITDETRHCAFFSQLLSRLDLVPLQLVAFLAPQSPLCVELVLKLTYPVRH